MGEINKARLLAHASLVACLASDKYVNLEVSSALNRSSLQGADRALYSAIVYGTVERLLTIDFIISRLSSRAISDIDLETLCAIRIGICQIGFMDRIPPHAAVSESVSLAPKKSRGFANAVLREYLRNPPKMPEKGKDFIKYLSVTYSAPRELCELFVHDYKDEAEGILASFLEKRDIAVHLNTLKINPLQIELDAKKSKLCSDVVLAGSFDAIGDGIANGKWFVQDEASAICVDILDPHEGETVIDTCSAPGGKSFACALKMKNCGKIYSFDLHENKLSLIKSGAKRLGVDIIFADVQDAKAPRKELIGTADRVLCDAPCSGFGVINKKPDIKYKSFDLVKNLPGVQLQVLLGASEYVKAGGILVYSTCTLNKKENEEVVEKFLSQNKSFTLCPFNVGEKKYDGMLTLLPHIDKTDGFFVCKMIKNKEN